METVALGSGLLRQGFIVLTFLLALGILWNVHLAGLGLRESIRRTRLFTAAASLAIAIWMTMTWQVASSGLLADFERRPAPILLLLVTVLTVSLLVAYTSYGTRFVTGLPLWILVAGQAFRFPLELLMHRAAEEGVMPPQMTYTGLNFDILTGLTALPVAWWLARGHQHARTVAMIWNVLGSLLLLNVLVVAMLSTPVFAAFGEHRLNTWVAHPPYVWLPTMFVVCAMVGHLVIFRKLRATAMPPL
jgi:hypothetical protein